MGGDTIRVVIRFRPVNKVEAGSGFDVNALKITYENDNQTVRLKSGDGMLDKKFDFDYIFNENTTQEFFYQKAAQDVVENLFKGYNATIFAYGQTGSGKTWSMMGPSYGGTLKDESLRGITPRSIDHIFSHVENSHEGDEYNISVSYLEIYKEKIKDLMKPENDNLPIHGTPETGIFVKNLSEVYVSSRSDIFDVIRKGDFNRAIASTKMNANSSRSHSVFVMRVVCKSGKDGSTTTAKLNLVDLAGSEKVGKTGAKGERLEEAKKINQSLSALGHCINSIVKNRKHIPYRDSKLTRILEESIGGRSKTTIVCACSMHPFNQDETVSTLLFGKRAKSIKVKVKCNKVLSVDELMRIIERLKKKLLLSQKKNKLLLQKLKELRALTPEEEKEMEKLKDLKVDPNSFGKDEDDKEGKKEGKEETEEESGEQEKEELNDDDDDVSTGGEGDSKEEINEDEAYEEKYDDFTIAQLKEEIDRLKAEKDNCELFFQENMDNEKSKASALEQKMEIQKKKMEQYEKENKVLKEENDKVQDLKKYFEEKLEFEMEKAKSEQYELQKQYEDVYKKLEESELRLMEMEDSGVSSGGSIKDPKKRGELQNEVEVLRRNNNELMEEMEGLMNNLEQAEAQNEKIREELVITKDALSQKTEKYKKLFDFKNTLIAEIERTHDEAEKVDLEIIEMSKQLEAYEQENIQLNKEMDIMEETKQQKTMLMRKMQFLMEQKGIDIKEVKNITLDHLMQREKDILEEMTEKEINSPREIAENLLDDEPILANLQQYETKEIDDLVSIVFENDKNFASGGVMQDDGRYIVGSSGGGKRGGSGSVQGSYDSQIIGGVRRSDGGSRGTPNREGMTQGGMTQGGMAQGGGYAEVFTDEDGHVIEGEELEELKRTQPELFEDVVMTGSPSSSGSRGGSSSTSSSHTFGQGEAVDYGPNDFGEEIIYGENGEEYRMSKDEKYLVDLKTGELISTEGIVEEEEYEQQGNSSSSRPTPYGGGAQGGSSSAQGGSGGVSSSGSYVSGGSSSSFSTGGRGGGSVTKGGRSGSSGSGNTSSSGSYVNGSSSGSSYGTGGRGGNSSITSGGRGGSGGKGDVSSSGSFVSGSSSGSSFGTGGQGGNSSITTGGRGGTGGRGDVSSSGSFVSGSGASSFGTGGRGSSYDATTGGRGGSSSGGMTSSSSGSSMSGSSGSFSSGNRGEFSGNDGGRGSLGQRGGASSGSSSYVTGSSSGYSVGGKGSGGSVIGGSRSGGSGMGSEVVNSDPIMLYRQKCEEVKEMSSFVEEIKRQNKELSVKLEKNEEVVEKEVETKTETMRKLLENEKISTEKLKEKVAQQKKQFLEKLKKKEERIQELLDERKDFFVEEQKAIEKMVSKEKGKKIRRGGYNGSLTDMVNQFFDLRMKYKKAQEDRRILHRNYSHQRKQNLVDRRKLREQESLVTKQAKRISELEYNLESTKEKILRRKDALVNLRDDKGRLEKRVTSLSEKISFLEGLIKREKLDEKIENFKGKQRKKSGGMKKSRSSFGVKKQGSSGSGGIVNSIGGGGGKVIKVIKGGGGKKN